MVRLFDPLTIGSLKLKNRLVLPPMRSRKSALNGEVTEELIQHYINLSDGPGLIIVEHAYIVDWGRTQPQLGISDDKYIHGLSKLAKAIHDKDTAIVLQISHIGSVAVSKVIGTQPTAPSAVISPTPQPIRQEKEMPRAMTKKEIGEVVQAFTQAARRAVEAGFDGVEVHGAHGYLLSQFASPITNLRQDEYGGSPENRVRFAEESIQAIRKVVDEDYPIFFRFSARDCLPNGLELSESMVMAKILVKAGVNVLDVSGGVGGVEPQGPKEQGFFIPEAKAIKKATGTIVIGVGGITEPAFADGIVKKGQADLVAVGRTMLKDPTWCKKALKLLQNENLF